MTRTTAHALLLLPLWLLSSTAIAAPEDPDASGDAREARSLSPYFFVAGGDPRTDRLPLKATSAEVHIAGTIANVRLHQVFESHGERAIEATYVFPASTRAAVHGMRMRVGDRIVDAVLERKRVAREHYERARSEGKRASLLEEERSNVFRMSVANVMPRDRIEVQLDYSELLVPERATYEFVLPGVVGPRYQSPTGHHPRDTRSAPTVHTVEGQPASYSWDVGVQIEGGVALGEVGSPSHRLVVTRPSHSAAVVKLAEPGRGDRDFVLRYRLAGGKIGAGMMVENDGAQQHFALLVEPPQRSRIEDTPPREYVFLLDVSGSMEGFPLGVAKELLGNLFDGLRPVDRFNIVLFSGSFAVMARQGSIEASAENLAAARSMIDRVRGGGGTELTGGLHAVYDIPRDPSLARSVVVITDGFVGVESETFALVRAHLGDSNLFAMGIGSSVNRALIEGMARAGEGEPFFVLGHDQAQAEAERLRALIDRPLLTNIHVEFEGVNVANVEPARLPDLMAERPLLLLGTYAGGAGGKAIITGQTATGPYRREVSFGRASSSGQPGLLRRLWARHRIAALEDDLSIAGGGPTAEGLTEEVATVALANGLLSRETSFVAIDHVVANYTGSLAEAPQPLPLPAGVENTAVGAEVSVSREEMPPGDPILTVVAPESARQVTAYFPFGLVKDLAFDPYIAAWQTRFLVPKEVVDGQYRVPVVIVHADGRSEVREATYRIDSSEPDFDLVLTPAAGGVRVVVTTAEPARLVTVALVEDPTVRVDLEPARGPASDGLHFEGFLHLPAGPHRLRVVVADKARNEAEHLAGCVVP